MLRTVHVAGPNPNLFHNLKIDPVLTSDKPDPVYTKKKYLCNVFGRDEFNHDERSMPSLL